MLSHELIQLEHRTPAQIIVRLRYRDVLVLQLDRARPRVQLDRHLIDALRQKDRHGVLERFGRVGQCAHRLRTIPWLTVVVHVDNTNGVILFGLRERERNKTRVINISAQFKVHRQGYTLQSGAIW